MLRHRSRVYAVAIDGSFGVRLTRIRRLHDALSWEMCTPGMRERLSTDLELSDALGAAEAGGTLFDLTRLVVAGDDTAPRRRELLRLRQLLVAALTQFILDSIDEDDNGALWIFATTPPLSTMLRHIGITHTIHARSDTGASPTLFCSGRPRSTLDRLQAGSAKAPASPSLLPREDRLRNG